MPQAGIQGLHAAPDSLVFSSPPSHALLLTSGLCPGCLPSLECPGSPAPPARIQPLFNGLVQYPSLSRCLLALQPSLQVPVALAQLGLFSHC